MKDHSDLSETLAYLAVCILPQRTQWVCNDRKEKTQRFLRL